MVKYNAEWKNSVYEVILNMGNSDGYIKGDYFWSEEILICI